MVIVNTVVIVKGMGRSQEDVALALAASRWHLPVVMLSAASVYGLLLAVLVLVVQVDKQPLNELQRFDLIPDEAKRAISAFLAQDQPEGMDHLKAFVV